MEDWIKWTDEFTHCDWTNPVIKSCTFGQVSSAVSAQTDSEAFHSNTQLQSEKKKHTAAFTTCTLYWDKMWCKGLERRGLQQLHARTHTHTDAHTPGISWTPYAYLPRRKVEPVFDQQLDTRKSEARPFTLNKKQEGKDNKAYHSCPFQTTPGQNRHSRAPWLWSISLFEKLAARWQTLLPNSTTWLRTRWCRAEEMFGLPL